MRYATVTGAAVLAVVFALVWDIWSDWRMAFAVLTVAMLTILALGIHDLIQTRDAILRNYPMIAHSRLFFEDIHPEIRQYLFEGDRDGAPFPRDQRAIGAGQGRSCCEFPAKHLDAVSELVAAAGLSHPS
ncbi:MAG: hypothetical protein V9G14_18495 [Cypionkella sp.]